MKYKSQVMENWPPSLIKEKEEELYIIQRFASWGMGLAAEW